MTEKMLPSGVSEKAEAARGSEAQETPPEELVDISDVIVRLIRDEAAGIAMKLNDEPVRDLIDLTNRLQAIVRVRSDVPVIVEPDSLVPIGDAVAAYDAARSAGAVRVFLTTEK